MQYREQYDEWAETIRRILAMGVSYPKLRAKMREHGIGTPGSNPDKNVAFVKELERRLIEKRNQQQS